MTLSELLAHPSALPSIPKTVSALLAELDQDEPDLRRLTQYLNTDPVLAARMLQLANSAHYQLTRRIATVGDALAVIGLREVRAIATAAAVAGAFRHTPGLDLIEFWCFSLDVAKLARHLARLTRAPMAESFTAGLVHATGELVMHLGLGARMAELPAHSLYTPQRFALEREALDFDYADVSAAFARQWHFPADMVAALQWQCQPRTHEHDAFTLTLHMAQWRVRAQRAGWTGRSEPQGWNPLWAQRLGLDEDEVLADEPVAWSTRAEITSWL
ncbi:MAG: HDOD domain-containing protein [Rhodoferax sp.]